MMDTITDAEREFYAKWAANVCAFCGGGLEFERALFDGITAAHRAGADVADDDIRERVIAAAEAVNRQPRAERVRYNFGDAPAKLAADALVAAGEDGLAVEILRTGIVSTDDAHNEIAAIARSGADYAAEFISYYAITGSKARYGSEEFDEIVDQFQRKIMQIDPDELVFHYPMTAVFDQCRGH